MAGLNYVEVIPVNEIYSCNLYTSLVGANWAKFTYLLILFK